MIWMAYVMSNCKMHQSICKTPPRTQYGIKKRRNGSSRHTYFTPSTSSSLKLPPCARLARSSHEATAPSPSPSSPSNNAPSRPSPCRCRPPRSVAHAACAMTWVAVVMMLPFGGCFLYRRPPAKKMVMACVCMYYRTDGRGVGSMIPLPPPINHHPSRAIHSTHTHHHPNNPRPPPPSQTQKQPKRTVAVARAGMAKPTAKRYSLPPSQGTPNCAMEATRVKLTRAPTLMAQ